MDADRLEHEQKLERQAQLLDTRAAKIKKLEGSVSLRLLPVCHSHRMLITMLKYLLYLQT